jgi:hypothetical protein
VPEVSPAGQRTCDQQGYGAPSRAVVPAPIRLGVGDGGQPGRCQSPSGGQPLDALFVRPGPAATTLSGDDEQLGAVGVDRFAEFCDRHLRHADDCMREYVQSAEFDRLLVATVQRAFPPHEHEQLVAHYRGLLGAWANDQRATAGQA